MVEVTPEIPSFLQRLEFERLVADNGVTAWTFLAGSVVVGLVAGRLIGWILRRVVAHFESRERPGRAQVFFDMIGPAQLAVLTVGLSVGVANLQIASPYLRVFASKTLLFLFTIAFFWYAYNLVAIIGLVVRKLRRGDDAFLNHQIVLLVSRSLRVFLMVIGVLYVAQAVFDQDVGAWLAGLGIAGLAVSLAAQDSLKHLFGSVTVLLDRSFRIGDTIVFAGTEGTVEDIDFRATKLRTAEGHLMTVPNSSLVNGAIVNVSRRPAVRRVVTLMIPAKNSPEKVRAAVAALSGIFAEESIRGPICSVAAGKVRPPQVNLDDIQADKFKVTVTYWYAPPGDPGYASHVGRVNFRILDVLTELGIELSE